MLPSKMAAPVVGTGQIVGAGLLTGNIQVYHGVRTSEDGGGHSAAIRRNIPGIQAAVNAAFGGNAFAIPNQPT